MSFLSEIHNYWSVNTTLNTALPATSVWTGVVPEAQSYPYAVITSIGNVPTPTTGNPYWSTFAFQISIFDTDPDNAESLGETVASQFDYKAISGDTMSCERQNGPILLVDTDTPLRVYHVMLEYRLLENRNLSGTFNFDLFPSPTLVSPSGIINW